jgi:hypothetical protein
MTPLEGFMEDYIRISPFLPSMVRHESTSITRLQITLGHHLWKGGYLPLKALFGCTCIHLNPYVLEWNGMKFSSIPLQSTSTHVDWDEYMCIQTRPKQCTYSIYDGRVIQWRLGSHIVYQYNHLGLIHDYHAGTTVLHAISIIHRMVQ